MNFQIFGIILSAVLGGAATITSALVLFNLRAMSVRIDKIELAHQKLFDRKNECHQDFVNKVDYIRSITSFESSMKQLIEKVSEMKGGLKVIEQLPQVCGSIAREIVKETRQ